MSKKIRCEMKQTAYFDRKACGWDTWQQVEVTRTFASEIGRAVPLTAESTAMELGCGTGIAAMELAARILHVVAADRSRGMLAELRSRLTASGRKNIEPRWFDPERVPKEWDRAFDLAFTIMTLHHVPDTKNILSLFFRALKPGGTLAVIDLCPEDGRFHGVESPVAHHGFDPVDLGRQLIRLGFERPLWRTVYAFSGNRSGTAGHKAYPAFLLTARIPDKTPGTKRSIYKPTLPAVVTHRPVSRLGDYLDVVKAKLPHSLISKESYHRIRATAGRFPGALAFSGFGFKCGLGSDQEDAGFMVNLDISNSGPDILAGRLPEHDFDSTLLNRPDWDRIREFGRLWGDGSFSAFRGVDDVRLEFDLEAAKSPLPQPKLFFGPFSHPGWCMGQNLATADLMTVMEHACACFCKGPATQTLHRFRRCVEALPGLLAPLRTGFMIHGTETQAIRICAALPSDVLSSYLESIRWPGDTNTVHTMMQRLAQWFDRVVLHLDVKERPGPVIGVECRFFKWRPGPRNRPWQEFLDFLVHQGLCSPEKRAAMEIFPGYTPTPGTCPQALGSLMENLALVYQSFFIRHIHHLRLTCGPDGTWKAQGYFMIKHLWKSISGEHYPGKGLWGII